MTRPIKVFLYAHTHWDREWYWPFERYRVLLLEATRQILDGLDSGELKGFHLDGQVCALEDIIEMEPQLGERIREHVGNRRLSIGPWYVLADQMLVGGEALVRNLEHGIKVCRSFGDPMKVGYCPDTFGHTQDLPRILRGFGIDSAVVWRGVPELDRGPEFFWRSPDGSEITAYLLANGYYQTAFHEVAGVDDQSISKLVDFLVPWFKQARRTGREGDPESDPATLSKTTNACLVPIGGDHIYPPKQLHSQLEAIRRRLKQNPVAGIDGGINLEPTMLADFLAFVSESTKTPVTPIHLIDGELRDNRSATRHCRAYMLPGVLSTRLYLKRENRFLEHRLTRLCEPLYTLLQRKGLVSYPASEITHAWRLLLRNHPHDSICGCSVDDVHREMQTRTKAANHLLDALDATVREHIFTPSQDEAESNTKYGITSTNLGIGRHNMDLADPDAAVDAIAVLNLTTRTISTPVQFKICRKVASSETGNTTTVLNDLQFDPDRVQLTRTYKEMDLFGAMGGVPEYKEVDIAEGWLYASELAPFSSSLIPLCLHADKKEAKASLQAVGTSGTRPTDTLPARGSSKRVDLPTTGKTETREDRAVSCGNSKLSNGFFDIVFGTTGLVEIKATLADGTDKTFPLGHTFRDLGDGGDSYNFDPVFGDSGIQARFIRLETGAAGPIVGSIKLHFEIELPSCTEITDDRSALSGMEDCDDLEVFRRSDQLITHELVTEITLKRGVPIVFFHTSWINQSMDHRLEVLLDTGAPIDQTWSENHFSLVERSVLKHATPLPVPQSTESELDRYPSQRFFVANGQVFINFGLPEYGAQGSTVSITVLRAISMLSRGRLWTRGGGAGPHMPAPEANSIGLNEAFYGWSPLDTITTTGSEDGKERRRKSKSYELSDAHRIAAYRLAELFEGPTFCAPVSSRLFSAKHAELEKTGVTIDSESVALTAFYSPDGGKTCCLRLLNVLLKPQVVKLRCGLPFDKASIVRLDGELIKPLSADEDGDLGIEFGPNQLLTIAFE